MYNIQQMQQKVSYIEMAILTNIGSESILYLAATMQTIDPPSPENNLTRK